jgi:pimeloyl-ACP methyl ester carboxylesterase
MRIRLLLPTAVVTAVLGGPLLVPEPRSSDSVPARHLADPDSRFARLAGVEVHHKVSGSDEAPAVLLSHHFYGSVPTWRHVMDGLSDEHRAVAFDRPGFGLTERVPREAWEDGRNPYTREAAASIGWQLLDHLGIERAVLVGSSAGGTNVLEMYAQQPHRVRGLVLVSPAITGDVGAPAQLRPFLRSPQARRIGPHLVQRLAGEVTLERISGSWHDPSRATAEDVESYRRMLEVEGWQRGFWELLTAEDPPNLRALLPTVDVPTLVISGASDRVITAQWNRRTAASIPGARFELLEDCGHTPQEECPDRLLPLLREFLDELDA